MDRERLGRLLEEPAKVAREDLAELKELTERYPWFTTAHLLRAVGEKAAGNVGAGTTLQKAAAHLPSRAVLFDLADISVEQAAQELRTDRKKEVPAAETRAEVAGKKEADRSADPIEAVAPGPKMKLVPAEEVAETSTSTKGTADPIDRGPTAIPKEEPIRTDVPGFKLKPVDPGPSQEGTTDPIDQKVSTSTEGTSEQVFQPENTDTDRKEEEKDIRSEKETLHDPTTAELEKQILEAALATAYDLTWKERIEKKPAPPARERPAGPIEKAAEKPQERSSGTTETPIGRAAIPKIDRNTKLKFTDWLSASSPTEKPISSADPGKGTPVSPEKKSETPAPAEKPIKPATDPRALIDRFIEHETPAPVRKAQFFTPQQAAKRSLDDTAGLVSETLARIYAEQGNIPKAIEAYERLALKYPEKSAYFAALSKELERRSNT